LTRIVARPADLKFNAMPNGTYQASVVGDVTKAGFYAARTKLPAGLRIPPHFHPDERIVLVVSGTLLVGYGERFDEAKMMELPAGSVFTEPARQSHFTWAKDGEVVLHVTGLGPSATTWLDQKK
jgi:quercetin dioxygenase-like cupin family protein